MANNQLDDLDNSILSKNALHMSRLTGGKKKKRKTTKRKTKKSKKTKKTKKTKRGKKTKKVKFSSPQSRLFAAMS
jgi:hypothetical protein